MDYCFIYSIVQLMMVFDDMRGVERQWRERKAGVKATMGLPPVVIVVVIDSVQGEVFMTIDHLHRRERSVLCRSLKF